MFNRLVCIGSIFIASFGFAQNVAVNNDGSSADASAMLDIKSTAKGVLVPRMSEAERDNIQLPPTGCLSIKPTIHQAFIIIGAPPWYPTGSP